MWDELAAENGFKIMAFNALPQGSLLNEVRTHSTFQRAL